MTLPMHILLVEDSPEHADLIRSHLLRKHRSSVQIEWVSSLTRAVEHLATGNAPDAILLDLGLPDSTIDQTLGRILEETPRTPIVVLSALDDEEFGMKAVHDGAQDYICKSWMDGEILFRSLRYAIERKSTEEELRKANRSKDEFLATLSHELRTPINVIHGFAELLSQGGSSEEERQRAIDAIVRNSKLQVGLINDMLDMSRIVTGKLMLNTVPLEVEPVLNHVVQTVQDEAKEKSILIETHFEPGPKVISGDSLRMHQIFWNILTNAIKFTPEKGHIDVLLRKIGNQLEIEVADNGEGISPEFLPFIFDRFSQQDGSIRRIHGGLGLGLSIVKNLVELHGGEISVTSKGREMGTSFKLRFPLQLKNIGQSRFIEESLKHSPDNKTPTKSQDAERPLRGIHTLAIDDSPDSLILTRVLLQRAGAIVTTARSSAEAREILRKVRPDVIICDIGMPEEDGYAFIKSIRLKEMEKGEPMIPATALTAYTREEERQDALRAGFQAHLSKPVEEKSLVRTILDLTSLHDMKQESNQI